TRAGEARIGIHRVLGRREPCRGDRGPKPRPRHGKERPQDRHAAGPDLAAHGSKTEKAGTTRQPQEQCLRLVIPMRGKKKMVGLLPDRSREKKLVARRRAAASTSPAGLRPVQRRIRTSMPRAFASVATCRTSSFAEARRP